MRMWSDDAAYATRVVGSLSTVIATGDDRGYLHR
jgi:hypothetical protein